VRRGVDKEDLEDWIANNQDEHTEEELAMIKKISAFRS
jgi:succinate dehydrogenase flavin-adding protein (antitoxin of CptAB toxin-antitoxin module)